MQSNVKQLVIPRVINMQGCSTGENAGVEIVVTTNMEQVILATVKPKTLAHG